MDFDIQGLLQEGSQLLSQFLSINNEVNKVTTDVQSKIAEVDKAIAEMEAYVNKLESARNKIKEKIQNPPEIEWMKPVSGFIIGFVLAVAFKKLRR